MSFKELVSSLTHLENSTYVHVESSPTEPTKSLIKVLRPSGPNYWKNVEWIPYVFCKKYCSECLTNWVMGQRIGTITFCHL